MFEHPFDDDAYYSVHIRDGDIPVVNDRGNGLGSGSGGGAECGYADASEMLTKNSRPEAIARSRRRAQRLVLTQVHARHFIGGLGKQ